MDRSICLPQAVHLVAAYDENARTRTLVFDARWQADPGQFLMAWLPRFDEKPFSLVDVDPVTIMVAAVGPFTTLLHRLQPGDRAWLRGPFGHGFSPATARVLAVGGGYGVAPLSFLARSAGAAGLGMAAVVGARTVADLLYVERLRREGADVHVTTEDGSAGAKGLVTTVVEPLLASGAFAGLYACGPHAMLSAMASLARAYRIPAQLSWEAYMRCGMGLCGSCEHDGRLLCLDGPVLNSSV